MVRYKIEDITEDMILGESVSLPSGKMLLNAGYTITARYKKRLIELGQKTLLIHEPGTEDVVPDTLVSNRKTDALTNSLDESEGELTKVLKTFRNDSHKKDVTKGIFEQRKNLNSFIMDPQMAHQLETIIEEITGEPEMVLNLAAQEKSDNTFLRHSLNVTITALCIGRKFKFNYDEIKQLGIGSLNYHIGMLALPDDILNPKEVLTEEQKKEYRKHTIYGHLMLSQNQAIPATSAIVALQHHEREDGKGYPLALKANNRPPVKDISQTHVIHRFAEIVSVADLYHRLLSPEFETDPRHISTALANLIKLSGPVLNREIVKAVTEIVPIYPIGTRVKITESPVPKLKQYIGVVSKDNPKDLSKPLILLYQTIHGKKVSPPIVLDPIKIPSLKFEILV